MKQSNTLPNLTRGAPNERPLHELSIGVLPVKFGQVLGLSRFLVIELRISDPVVVSVIGVQVHLIVANDNEVLAQSCLYLAHVDVQHVIYAFSICD